MEADYAHETEFRKLRTHPCCVELLRLMLEIARDAYPGLDVDATMGEVERLRNAARDRLDRLRVRGAGLGEQLRTLSRFLFSEEGFCGNSEDYYDPRNSYLNEVLARRTGIPISLSLLYLGVGRACGLDLHGVAAPAHFVVGCCGEEGRWFIDAFHGGDVLTSVECRRRIEQLMGQKHTLSEAQLAPATSFEIAVRMLRNLKACHVGQSRWEQSLPVQRRLTYLLPDSPVERRDLGLIYLRCERPYEALHHLGVFAETACPADREEVAPYLRLARRLICELN